MKILYSDYQAFLVARHIAGKKKHITFLEYSTIVINKNKLKENNK